MTAKARSGISSTPCGGPLRGGLHQMVVARGSCSAKQFTPRSVEVAAFASLRKNFLRVASAMQEAGMQHGSLIRLERRGPRAENKAVTDTTFIRFRGRAARLEVNPMGESPIDRAIQWLS